MARDFRKQPRLKKTPRRGSVLVIVLWGVVILSVIVLNFAFQVKTHLRLSSNYSERATLRNIASAGVEYAIAFLLQDRNPVDHLNKDWAFNDKEFSDVTVGDGSFSLYRTSLKTEEPVAYGMEDEASKLNLRTATEEMLQKLKGMDKVKIDSLLDWQDEDMISHADGAEEDYYQGLEKPYHCKNAKLTTLAELRLVRGFDVPPEMAEQETNPDETASAQHKGVRTIAFTDPELMKRLTLYSSDRNITATGADRINVNEATEEQMKKGISGLQDDIAHAIAEYRKSHKFENIGDLLNVTPPSNQQGNTPSSRSGDSQTSSSSSSNTQGLSSSGLSHSGLSDSGLSKPQIQTQNSTQTQNQAQNQGQGENKQIITSEMLKQIIDCCSINNDKMTEGRININTASFEVLMTLPGMTEEITRAIIAQREKSPFANIAGLLDIPLVTKDIFIKLSNLVTVRSFQFWVRSEGHLKNSRARRTVDAIVDRSGSNIKILYWNED